MKFTYLGTSSCEGIPALFCNCPRCEGARRLGGKNIRTRTQALINEDLLIDLAELFRVLGDSTRVRILYALYETELCVCDIAALLGMTVSAISHQLRILKSAKLVTFRREGKAVFYALADDHVHTILGMGMAHISEEEERSIEA